MATYIENQPVLFGESDDCDLDEMSFNQIVDIGDTTQFQMKLDICEGIINSISNPNFNTTDDWNLGDGWTIADNLLCVPVSSVSGTSYNFDFDETKYYEVDITVNSISPGASIEVLLGGTSLGFITNTGSFTFWGSPTIVFSHTYLTLLPQAADTTFCISEVDVYEMLLNNIVNIFDANDNYITSISQVNNSDNFNIDFDKQTVNIDWLGQVKEAGCYKLCWADACVNDQGQNYPAQIINCDFTGTAHDWDLGSDWHYSSDHITGSTGFPVFAPAATLSQAGVFPIIGISYCVTIVITSLTGSVGVYFGTNLVQTLTTPGTYNICGAADDNIIKLVMARDTSVSVDSICPQAYNPDTANCNYTSNIFKVGDYSNSCTLLINISNNSTGFGFDYTNFLPSVRIEGKLRQSSYKGDIVNHTDSKGSYKVDYFSGVKHKNLATSQLPEYIHDFLRLAIGCDNFQINNFQYFVFDTEYQVIRDISQDNFGYVNIIVGKNGQNARNSNCNSSESDSCSSGNFLLLEDGETITL